MKRARRRRLMIGYEMRAHVRDAADGGTLFRYLTGYVFVARSFRPKRYPQRGSR